MATFDIFTHTVADHFDRHPDSLREMRLNMPDFDKTECFVVPKTRGSGGKQLTNTVPRIRIRPTEGLKFASYRRVLMFVWHGVDSVTKCGPLCEKNCLNPYHQTFLDPAYKSTSPIFDEPLSFVPMPPKMGDPSYNEGFLRAYLNKYMGGDEPTRKKGAAYFDSFYTNKAYGLQDGPTGSWVPAALLKGAAA
jgi:hypothetical protein